MIPQTQELAALDVCFPPEEAHNVLCYPFRPSATQHCEDLIKRIRSYGIECLVSFDRVSVGRFKVLGKGHAGVVLLARHSSLGVVAVKVRRLDSKRESLEFEGELMSEAFKLGVAPRVYIYDKDVVVREYIDGVEFGEAVNFEKLDHTSIKLLIELIFSALILDIAGIDLEELTNPSGQVIVSRDGRLFFVDFESAKRRANAANVNKILSYIIRGLLRTNRARTSENLITELTTIAHSYKSCGSDPMCRRAVVSEACSILLRIR